MKQKRILIADGAGLKSVSLDTMLRQSQGWTSLMGDSTQDGIADYYRRVPWLYAGVNLIARSVATLPVRFTRDGEPVEVDTAEAWLGSFTDLLDALAGDLVLYGAAYVFLGRNARNTPTEMRRLLPPSVSPQLDAARGLTGFERVINGQRIPLRVEDVVYVWLPNRTGELGPGPAPAHAALAASGALANIDASMEGLFANGAIRPTIAYIEDNMPDAELERVESTIKRRLMGVKHAFGITAVSKKVEFSTVGEYPDRLAMPELTDSKRQDIATALGVPQTLLFSDASNYATAQQDDLTFYDKTVIPYAKRLLSAFNTQVLDRFGLVAQTAENELEIYQRMQGEQVTALAAMFDRSVITVNEFRDRVGLTPLEDPDMETEDEPADAEEPDSADMDETALPEPDEDPAERQRDELRTWQRFVLKRVKEGKAGRAFKAEAVPPALAAAIEGQLESAQSAADVKAVFDHAIVWAGYP